MTFTLPLVAYFGGGNDQLGFSMTLAFFGVIAAVLLFVAFRNLREVNVEKIKRIPIKDSIRAIKGNWPWMILVAANLIFWIVLTIRQSTVVYYCQYVLGDKGIAAMINGFMVIQVLGMLSIPFLVHHTSKHTTMIIGFVLAILGHIGMYFAGAALSVLVSFWCIGCIGQGIACSMPFAMLSDTVDYGEWKTGIIIPMLFYSHYEAKEEEVLNALAQQ